MAVEKPSSKPAEAVSVQKKENPLAVGMKALDRVAEDSDYLRKMSKLKKEIEKAYDRAKLWPPLKWSSLPSRDQFETLFAEGFNQFAGLDKCYGWVKLRNGRGDEREFMILFSLGTPRTVVAEDSVEKEPEDSQLEEYIELKEKFAKKWGRKRPNSITNAQMEQMAKEIVDIVKLAKELGDSHSITSYSYTDVISLFWDIGHEGDHGGDKEDSDEFLNFTRNLTRRFEGTRTYQMYSKEEFWENFH